MNRNEELLDTESRQKIRDFKGTLGVLKKEVEVKRLRKIKRNAIKYSRPSRTALMDYTSEVDAVDDDPAVKAYQNAIKTYESLGEWETVVMSISDEAWTKVTAVQEQYERISRDDSEWQRRRAACHGLMRDALRIFTVFGNVRHFLRRSRRELRKHVFDEMLFFNREARAVERVFSKPFPKDYQQPPEVTTVASMKVTVSGGNGGDGH